MPPAKKSAESAQKTAESAPKSAEAGRAPKSPDALDSALGLVSPTLDFLKSNLASLFVKMLKVEFSVLLVNFLLLVAVGLVTVGILAAAGAPLASFNALVAYVLANRMLLALTAVWLLAAELAVSWISTSIAFTALQITKEQFEGAYSGIWPIWGRMRLRVLGYTLLNFVITVVFLGIPVLLLILLQGHPAVFWIAAVALLVYAMAFIVAYHFLSQFWRWELAVGGKQAYEALASSISLVRENLFGVLAYDVVAIAGYLIIAVPFILVLIGLAILSSGLELGAAVISPWAYVAAVALSALVRAVVTGIDTSLSNSVLLPYAYPFWNGIRKKQ
jgi:hypothetical protein